MTADLSKYRPVVLEALEAFRSDPTYAIDMAKQAALIRSRRGPLKLELAPEADSAV